MVCNIPRAVNRFLNIFFKKSQTSKNRTLHFDSLHYLELPAYVNVPSHAIFVLLTSLSASALRHHRHASSVSFLGRSTGVSTWAVQMWFSY